MRPMITANVTNRETSLFQSVIGAAIRIQHDRQCIDAKARSTDGMDIADAISQVDSGSRDRPVSSVTIDRVELGSS